MDNLCCGVHLWTNYDPLTFPLASPGSGIERAPWFMPWKEREMPAEWQLCGYDWTSFLLHPPAPSVPKPIVYTLCPLLHSSQPFPWVIDMFVHSFIHSFYIPFFTHLKNVWWDLTAPWTDVKIAYTVRMKVIIIKKKTKYWAVCRLQELYFSELVTGAQW